MGSVLQVSLGPKCLTSDSDDSVVENIAMLPVTVVVEEHADRFVAYPIGIDAVITGEGNTYEAALADVASAIRFHLETFGETEMVRA
jgi:hypothetical protein